jgi:hypothetical protein
MKMMQLVRLFALAVAAGVAAHGHAAFIVEAHSSGKASATNFAIIAGAGNATGATASTKSNAVGLTGTNSIFSSNNTVAGVVDTYQFTYRLGTDADNTVFNAGDALGDTRIDPPGNPGGVSAEAQVASGLAGGGSGLYKVFITWPGSGNVNTAGSIITITSDGSPIVLNPVDQNNAAANGPTPSGSGGANKWLLIGSAPLTSGNAYTVTMVSNADSFVSQRVHGVMWERAIPEPASLGLAGLAGVALAATRRRVA